MDKLLTISDVYQPPTANELASAYSANLQNRLAQMQMAEYEKKMAKEAQRNELAKKYFTAASPQIGTAGAAQIGTPPMPAETVWGAPQQSSSMMSTLGQSPTGPYASNGELSPFATRYNPAQAASPDYAPAVAPSADYQPAVSATQDMAGYQQALYGAGDIEGAMAIQAQVEAQKERAFTLSQKQIEPRMNFYKQFLDNAIKEGNNNTVQQVLANMKNDPALKNAIPSDFSITVSPTGETQTVLDVKEGMPGPDGRPITDPFTGQPVPPGKYKITAKNSQISKIEPFVEGIKERQLDIQDRRMTETERHNREMEAVSSARLAKTLSDRPLPPKTIDSFNDLQDRVERLQSLSNSFKPSYGGNTILGGWANTANELTGSNLDKVNWWKDYKEMDAVMRNAIFGASLTGNERQSWDAITVRERSDPKVIKQAVENRLRILSTAFNRIKNSYEAGKYDVSGFQNVNVPPSEGFTAPSSGAPSARPKPKF